MKLHATAINKLIELFHLHGGATDEHRLKAYLANLDFTPYERKTTANQEMILVLTEDFIKSMNIKM